MLKRTVALQRFAFVRLCITSMSLDNSFLLNIRMHFMTRFFRKTAKNICVCVWGGGHYIIVIGLKNETGQISRGVMKFV